MENHKGNIYNCFTINFLKKKKCEDMLKKIISNKFLNNLESITFPMKIFIFTIIFMIVFSIGYYLNNTQRFVFLFCVIVLYKLGEIFIVTQKNIENKGLVKLFNYQFIFDIIFLSLSFLFIFNAMIVPIYFLMINLIVFLIASLIIHLKKRKFL